jgi:hypothetical protein
MNNKKKLVGTLALVQFCLIIGSCNFRDQPIFLERRRPANVPADAALVEQPKGGLWERCMFDTQQSINRCDVYNWRGGVIYGEEFLPYDGGDAVKQEELKIPKYAPLASPDVICLQNGRMLLPKSAFDRSKKHLDWIAGKRSSPF